MKSFSNLKKIRKTYDIFRNFNIFKFLHEIPDKKYFQKNPNLSNLENMYNLVISFSLSNLFYDCYEYKI
jgi:hypothetical protein